MRILCRLVIGAALVCACATGTVAATVGQVAKAVDRRYNSLRTLQAHFVQIYTFDNNRRTESGTLQLLKPGRMRWSYVAPIQKLFLVDGHHAWLYLPGDRQVQRSSLKHSNNLKTPLRFLLGHTNLPKEFKDLSFGGLNPLWPGDLVLRGVPKRGRKVYREVLLEVGPRAVIRRIVIRQTDGSETDFRLSQIRLNPNLNKALFTFTPPPGVHVVEGSE